MQPGVTRISCAHESSMPVLIGMLAWAECSLVKFPASEPPRNHEAISFDDSHIDTLPASLDKRYHCGDHEKRHANAEAEP